MCCNTLHYQRASGDIGNSVHIFGRSVPMDNLSLLTVLDVPVFYAAWNGWKSADANALLVSSLPPTQRDNAGRLERILFRMMEPVDRQQDSPERGDDACK
jgi:hypothetical protein